MSPKLKILFATIDAVGHVSAGIGMAQVLREAGHEVAFMVNEQWRGKLEPYGIVEFLLTREKRAVGVNPAHQFAQELLELGILGPSTPLEKAHLQYGAADTPWGSDEPMIMDRDVERVLREYGPHVLVCDQVTELTAVVRSGIPWVLVCSGNPLMILDDHRTPPAISGLPAIGAEKEWQVFRDTVDAIKQKNWHKLNDYVVSRGVPALKKYEFINHSKYLNIYGYPAELDYTDVRPLPPHWHRFDNFMRTDKQAEFEIPVPLRDRPGKLVYFSLGSMGAIDVKNMKRLVTILSKSKHRFIVSKGPLHEEYELPDNMWGAATVPQTQVLPLVDLVVTHGGNNTITETMYFGKPMIVMPLISDQYDNAQRVHEKGFGIRVDAYRCSENELLDAIDKLLNDKPLNDRMRQISQRIQSDNSLAKLPEMIEKLVEKCD